jgi:hypothetical protein
MDFVNCPGQFRAHHAVPVVGSQILSELGSPEDFHVMEAQNVSKDGVNVTRFCGIASVEWRRD